MADATAFTPPNHGLSEFLKESKAKQSKFISESAKYNAFGYTIYSNMTKVYNINTKSL